MRLLIFLFLLAQSGALCAAEQTVILSVPSMNCPVCPITVKKSLQKVEGVKLITVSYENKTAEVTVDENTPIKRLLEATENAGYPATVLKNSH